jgi:sugar/nucleoside kinase (ribokinase family)
MRQRIERVIQLLNENQVVLNNRRGLIGFDGFVDSIVKPIRMKDEDNQFTYFQSMRELGEYIASKEGFSSAIELDDVIEKAGGNGPILAGALGKLGVRVDCICALGESEIHPVFQSMQDHNCNLYSFADPGYTTSIEFDSGKLMLARMNKFGSLDWAYLKQHMGVEKLIQLFAGSDMIGVVNWSEIYHMNTIWEGILQEIMPVIGPNRGKFLFLDLADCSGRKKEHIESALVIMKSFTPYNRVVFGMNENEARLIYQTLYNEAPNMDLAAMGRRMYCSLGIDTLLIHNSRSCLGWDETGAYTIDNHFVNNPLVLTGVGDNFNAGYCVGKLIGLDIESSMVIASAVAGFYVRRGYGPRFDELLESLSYWRETIAIVKG